MVLIKETCTSVSRQNRRSEIAWIARQIIDAVRNKGIRYRQIALVVRDLEPYEPHVREIFGMFNIPRVYRQARRYGPSSACGTRTVSN